MARCKNGVGDGARTHDRWNHNPELYQLSYAHHCPARYSTMFSNCPVGARCGSSLGCDGSSRTASIAGKPASTHPSPTRASSIQTGAPGRTRTCNPRLRRPMLCPVELRAPWSGWRDSNPRPTAPKAVALPGCATPRVANNATAQCYGLVTGMSTPQIP